GARPACRVYPGGSPVPGVVPSRGTAGALHLPRHRSRPCRIIEAPSRPTRRKRRTVDIMASKLLGAQVKRKEDPRLITGASQYVADVALPGLQHAAFVRSPHAHARVRGIDGSAALRRPGVVGVVTGRDLMAHTVPLPIATVSAEGGGESVAEVGRQHY